MIYVSREQLVEWWTVLTGVLASKYGLVNGTNRIDFPDRNTLEAKAYNSLVTILKDTVEEMP